MALDVSPVTAADMRGDAPQDGPPKRTPEQLASYWLGNISFAEKKRKPFVTRGRQIIKRYRNKRTLTVLGVPIEQRKMNVLWSNVQTQKPVLYAQTPKANVSRRNKAVKDPIGRMASIVLQNCLQNSMGMEDFDYVLTQVVEDRLLPGAGLAMVEYVPEVQKDQVGWQAAETRYVHWEDWLTNVARTPQEVWFWAYKAYLTRKECYDVALRASGDEEFAQKVWQEITLDHKQESGGNDEKNTDESAPAKALVWCIWDKTEKQVVQLAPGFPSAPLAVLPPPVNFDGFFPFPRPLTSTTTTDTTNPVPDFDQYVDQADEIDLLTQRIGLLVKSLRARGVYAGDIDGIKELMQSGDSDLTPIHNMSFLLEKGGLEKAVLWMPIDMIAACLMQCYQARQNAIDIMYQVTGISDIMRGASEASETATAQQLKAQFGGVRIRESQKDVQRFIRDILRLKSEIICEHFTLDVIKAMSGVRLLTEQEKVVVGQAAQMWQQFEQAQQQFMQMQQQPPQPDPMTGMAPPMPAPPQQPPVPQPNEEMLEALEEPSWEQVMAILQNEKLRGFVVDVETDSTIEPDQMAQQQAAVNFTQAVAQFMTAALPIVQASPDAAEFIGEMMVWTTRQWKAADTIEGAVDEFVEKMKKQAKMPPPPNPQMEIEKMKGQAEVKKADAQVQVAQIGVQQKQIELAGDQVRHQQDMQKLAFQAANPQPPQEGPPQ